MNSHDSISYFILSNKHLNRYGTELLSVIGFLSKVKPLDESGLFRYPLSKENIVHNLKLPKDEASKALDYLVRVMYPHLRYSRMEPKTSIQADKVGVPEEAIICLSGDDEIFDEAKKIWNRTRYPINLTKVEKRLWGNMNTILDCISIMLISELFRHYTSTGYTPYTSFIIRNIVKGETIISIPLRLRSFFTSKFELFDYIPRNIKSLILEKSIRNMRAILHRLELPIAFIFEYDMNPGEYVKKELLLMDRRVATILYKEVLSDLELSNLIEEFFKKIPYPVKKYCILALLEKDIKKEIPKTPEEELKSYALHRKFKLTENLLKRFSSTCFRELKAKGLIETLPDGRVILAYGKSIEDIHDQMDRVRLSVATCLEEWLYSKNGIISRWKFKRGLKRIFEKTKILRLEGDEQIIIPERKITSYKTVKKVRGREVEVRTRPLYIPLGKAVETGQLCFWDPYKENNPHLLIVGESGTGKTQTLKAIIYELSKVGIPCLIIDFHNEYTEVAEKVVDMRNESLNPLECYKGTSPIDIIYSTVAIFKRIYRLGYQQESVLRRAIRTSYEDFGIAVNKKVVYDVEAPSFIHVKNNLIEMMNDSALSRQVVEKLMNKLYPIFDLGVFSKPTTLTFEELFTTTVAIQLKELPTDELKTLVASFLIRKLWHDIMRKGESHSINQFIVIDEAHRMDYRDSPIHQLLREVRKYGVGVLLASQKPRDFSDITLSNVATIIAFHCPHPQDASFLARHINTTREEIQALTTKFTSLVKFSTSIEPIKVRIKPYYERRRSM